MNEQTGRGMRLKRWTCVCAHCVESPLIAALHAGARTTLIDNESGEETVNTTTPTPYAPHLTPHLNMRRDLKFGGAWFEVCIDCQEPDEPGEVTHPDNYFIEGVKLGGVWWGAEDVLSEYLRQCLDETLRATIAEEHREALKA